MNKEALKLAIEAADELEWMLKSGYEQRREGPPRVHRLIGKIKALAQPAQQEPVKVKTCDTCQFGERCNQWSCKNHSLWKPVQPAQQQERLTKAEQRMVHDFPHLAQFHAKHALGPMLPPSCLCCGHQTNPITHPVAVQHMELPGVVICKSCHEAALAQPQQEPVAIDRIIECANRLVDHADFQLGGVLSQDSKAKDIPSRAVSQVKARHLAALRDALANTSPPAQRKPLTDGEIEDLAKALESRGNTLRQFARAIEAAHNIKENT